ncbi:kinase-like domain-containing protein, partial [Gigaspora rosea]
FFYFIYIIFHDIRRNSKHGKCENCNENNTQPAWCLTCDPDIIAQGWTSRNKDVDDCIRKFQLRANKYEDAIEWIPFDGLFDVKEIGKGGFGSVYSATWLDGIRNIDHNKNRARETSSTVALKTLSSTKENNFDFLKEFKNHVQCINWGSKLKIYGLTQNTETNEYLMVLQYADKGNLHKFLKTSFRELKWELKLKQLKEISYDLYQIHRAGYVHADFHSGNILQNQYSEKNIQSYVADLGLSKKKDEQKLNDEIYGVMPYVAPEVLLGGKFTQAADIYSFGVIMAEMSTGKRPFDEQEFGAKLAVRICKGERPEFAPGTPEFYVELAKKCMDSDPQKRPSAWDVYYKISVWFEDKNKIRGQFLDADKVIKTLPINSPSHPDHMYTSKLISTKLILNAIKEVDSTQIKLDISK